jgi:hypothetical protein
MGGVRFESQDRRKKDSITNSIVNLEASVRSRSTMVGSQQGATSLKPD